MVSPLGFVFPVLHIPFITALADDCKALAYLITVSLSSNFVGHIFQ